MQHAFHYAGRTPSAARPSPTWPRSGRQCTGRVSLPSACQQAAFRLRGQAGPSIEANVEGLPQGSASPNARPTAQIPRSIHFQRVQQQICALSSMLRLNTMIGTSARISRSHDAGIQARPPARDGRCLGRPQVVPDAPVEPREQPPFYRAGVRRAKSKRVVDAHNYAQVQVRQRRCEAARKAAPPDLTL